MFTCHFLDFSTYPFSSLRVFLTALSRRSATKSFPGNICQFFSLKRVIFSCLFEPPMVAVLESEPLPGRNWTLLSTLPFASFFFMEFFFNCLTFNYCGLSLCLRSAWGCELGISSGLSEPMTFHSTYVPTVLHEVLASYRGKEKGGGRRCQTPQLQRRLLHGRRVADTSQHLWTQEQHSDPKHIS